MTDNLPPLPKPLRYAETVYEECGFLARRGIIPRRWAGDPAIVDEALKAALGPRRKHKRRRRYWATFGGGVAEVSQEPDLDYSDDIDLVDESELFERLIGNKEVPDEPE